MIHAAAMCPHPPLLVRELTGLQDPVPELRHAALTVVRGLLDGRPERVVVVGGVRPGESGGVRRFGGAGASAAHPAAEAPGPPDAARDLPLSLTVGSRLLVDAGWDGPVELRRVDAEAGAAELEAEGRQLQELPGRVALLVLGDGTARRGPKAPGFLDQRAQPFDDVLVTALREGDPRALLALDPVLARELMCEGRAAFTVLGAAVMAQGGSVSSRLVYADDPFGVLYAVALWELH